MHPFIQMHASAGAENFTKIIVENAPFFGSIDPILTKLDVGAAEVSFKKQPQVQNHIGTVHAIAMCNAAELVAGMATTVSIPENARWIPKGMTVAYLAKAKTDLIVKTEAKDVNFSQEGDIVVPVAAYDTENAKVFTAEITMNVKHS